LEGLYVHPNIDLYVTGSNAFLLSSELATLLTGRAYEIHFLPFSFAEYISFTGKSNNLAVDFVVRSKEGFTQYIQVSQTVQHPTTLARELAPLNSISDHHEKWLITMYFDTGTYNGIKKINAIDWLIGK
jgi:predicted AAA+ superfamily ATPase